MINYKNYYNVDEIIFVFFLDEEGYYIFFLKLLLFYLFCM